jgi:hypothetical protein
MSEGESWWEKVVVPNYGNIVFALVLVGILIVFFTRIEKKDGFLKSLTPVRSDTSKRLEKAIADFEKRQESVLENLA